MTLHLRQKAKLPFDRDLFLSSFGGFESGVATTTGIVVGLLITGGSPALVTTAAYIALSIQAFNAAVARYVNLRTSLEIDDQTLPDKKKPLANAFVQFVSHIAASSMPIVPLFLFQDPLVIGIFSMFFAFITLFLTGLLQGIFLKVQARENLRVIIFTGMMVVLVGSIAGILLR